MATYRGLEIKGEKPTIERCEDGCLEGYNYRGKFIRRDEHNKGEWDNYTCYVNKARRYFFTLRDALIAIDNYFKN